MGDVRIIGGQYGSRRIRVPASVARPTTDRVRESLFSSLESRLGGFKGVRVLDAFAGSGALGLEAVSRGASFACLVERDPQAAKTVSANMRSLGCGLESVRLLRADVLANAERIALQGPYDVVFLDPPYVMEPCVIRAFLDELAAAQALQSQTLIVYEHVDEAASAVTRAFSESPFPIVQERRWGKTRMTLLQPR